MKMFSVLVTAAGVLVVTGYPVRLAAAPSLLAVWHTVSQAAAGPGASAAAIVDAGAQWTECGSLLLLATGMFGAAVLVGRGRP
jgi:hypothetical protein